MRRFFVQAVCDKCGCNSFKIAKTTEGANKKDMIYKETLFHDGYGWDLNTFHIVCARCKSKNKDKFEVEQIGRKEQQRTIHKGESGCKEGEKALPLV